MPIPPRYPVPHYRPGERYPLADGSVAELVEFKEFAYRFAREVWAAKVFKPDGKPYGYHKTISLVRPADKRNPQ